MSNRSRRRYQSEPTATDPRGGLDRRHFLQVALVTLPAMVRDLRAQSPAIDKVAVTRRFEEALHKIEADVELTNQQRMRTELREGFKAGLERAPLRATKSKTPISALATKLIIECEVSNRTAYERSYEYPVWPKGESGVTIGIGYDLGYVTPSDFNEDWVNHLSPDLINQLSPACGSTGSAAASVLKRLPKVLVKWDVAEAQYFQEAQPRYVGITENGLANTKDLSPESLGALVSLVYNRGPSFTLPGPRYLEMRNIRDHMAARHYNRIASEIRSMKRLWENQPDMRGLLPRRDAEAALFELGL